MRNSDYPKWESTGAADGQGLPCVMCPCLKPAVSPLVREVADSGLPGKVPRDGSYDQQATRQSHVL